MIILPLNSYCVITDTEIKLFTLRLDFSFNEQADVKYDKNWHLL